MIAQLYVRGRLSSIIKLGESTMLFATKNHSTPCNLKEHGKNSRKEKNQSKSLRAFH